MHVIVKYHTQFTEVLIISHNTYLSCDFDKVTKSHVTVKGRCLCYCSNHRSTARLMQFSATQGNQSGSMLLFAAWKKSACTSWHCCVLPEFTFVYLIKSGLLVLRYFPGNRIMFLGGSRGNMSSFFDHDRHKCCHTVYTRINNPHINFMLCCTSGTEILSGD